jgi:hypothetical protein
MAEGERFVKLGGSWIDTLRVRSIHVLLGGIMKYLLRARLAVPTLALGLVSLSGCAPMAPGIDGSLILNGDFAQGSTHWNIGTFNGAAASLDVSEKVATIEVRTPGSSSGDIQFSQSKPGFEVTDGATYCLEFSASTSVAATFTVTISENGLDVDQNGFLWSPHATAVVSCTPATVPYSFDLQARGSNPRAALVFYLGKDLVETVWLSHVSLVAVRPEALVAGPR